MKLHYRGSIHRLSGSGMAFAHFDSDVDLSDVGKKINTAVPDTFIRVNNVDEEANFDVFFFDKPTNYIIRKGEEILYKHEGNAFGFEMYFSLIE